MKILRNKKLLILSITAIALLTLTLGVSYAYFTTPGSTGTEETITSGTMALTFTDGPQINATNLAPGDYIEKTFSVTNTGTLATTYDVYLSEVVNTFVQKNDLVYELTSNDGGYNTPNQVVVPNQEAKIVDTQSIAVGATHHYTLKITYKLTNQIQNDNMGRGFTAKISINEYNLNSTEKLLKLLDTSGNIVDKQMISSGVTDYYYNLANTSLTGTTNIYCNNGGIPRIENNQLIVSGLTVDTECKMSADIVDTVNNRTTTSKTGIVMTNNQSNITKMDVNSSKEVILDLNGISINTVSYGTESTTYVENHTAFVLSNGTLTVNDSVGTGGIYTGKDGRIFFVNGNTNLTINGGSYTGRQSIYTNSKNSNITINDGNFYQLSYEAIGIGSGTVNFNINVNGGNFYDEISDNVGLIAMNTSNSNNIIFNGGNYNSIDYFLNISSGSAGSVNVNGGHYVSNKILIKLNSGLVNINGGHFESIQSNVINTAINGSANINGGYFIADYDDVIANAGTINIYGGEFTSLSTDSTITNFGVLTFDDNQATFNNGKYVSGIYVHNDSDQHSMIANFETLIIKNGTFETPNFIPIYNVDGNTTIYNGNFIGGYGVLKVSAGNIYVIDGNYNGIVRSQTNGTYASGIIYICGGSFNSNDVNIGPNDSTAQIKYKSAVLWNGTSTPTVGGTCPATVSLDDTITCPS